MLFIRQQKKKKVKQNADNVWNDRSTLVKHYVATKKFNLIKRKSQTKSTNNEWNKIT